jgi:hypothetical protein
MKPFDLDPAGFKDAVRLRERVVDGVPRRVPCSDEERRPSRRMALSTRRE